jgi:hypothetical protein
MRSQRLAYERKVLIKDRQASLRKYYNDYRLLESRSKPIKECFLLPRDYDVFQSESITRVIYREDDKGLSDLDRDVVELKANLPLLVQNWMDKQILDMAAKLPTLMASTSNTGGHEAAIMARRQLTLSVFRCTTPYCITARRGLLIGWEDAIAHGCYGVFPSTATNSDVEYHPHASSAVASMARLFNLDPVNTHPSTIDRLDPRIVCTACLPTSKGRRPAMTWREAVRFFAIYISRLGFADEGST